MIEANEREKRILIADDHILVRDAVCEVIRSQGTLGVEVADSFATTVSAIRSAGPFDITLLDVNMPGMEGITSIENIVKEAGSGKVVLFSGDASHNFIMQSVAVGARGFIPKTMRLSALGNALKIIESGELFIPGSILSREIEDRGTAANRRAAGVPEVSEKEREILKLVATGLQNKEIAWRCGLSEVRVKMHMRAACKKLNATNRTMAAMMAKDLGLL